MYCYILVNVILKIIYCLVYEGQIIVFGGADSFDPESYKIGNVYSDILLLNPITWTWTRKDISNNTLKRVGHTSLLIENQMLIMQGMLTLLFIGYGTGPENFIIDVKYYVFKKEYTAPTTSLFKNNQYYINTIEPINQPNTFILLYIAIVLFIIIGFVLFIIFIRNKLKQKKSIDAPLYFEVAIFSPFIGGINENCIKLNQNDSVIETTKYNP